MIDIESARIYFSLNKGKLLFGLPIFLFMVAVGGFAAYFAVDAIDIWWVFEVCVAFAVFIPVAHVSGVVAGLTMERIIGDSE